MGAAVAVLGLWLLRSLRSRGQFRLASPSPRGTGPEGFAGWLLALVILQWVAVLSALGALRHHLHLFERHAEMVASRPAVLAELLLDIAVLVFVAWSAVVMTNKRRLYVGFFRMELVLFAVVPMLSLTGTASETQYVTQPKAWLMVAVRLGLSAAIVAIGFAYSVYSVRFRNTFVR